MSRHHSCPVCERLLAAIKADLEKPFSGVTNTRDIWRDQALADVRDFVLSAMKDGDE